MKKYFYIGIIGLVLFEILKVYFIMPFPGSQQNETIAVAYFLNSYRWLIRIIFGLMIVISFYQTWCNSRKWLVLLSMLLATIVVYTFNFKALAEKMFIQPVHLILKNKSENKVPLQQQVIAIENNNEAKAYPIEFLTFHHQVRDSIGGKQIMATFCSVCRTGRIFSPTVNGVTEKFRLVGMDHFNAMFEDATTHSWWRQENGESIAGPLKGIYLPELSCVQMTVQKFFELYPNGLVMQPDPTFISEFDTSLNYETGKSESSLTGTDTTSWNKKSWVIGIKIGKESKVYDWNEFKNNKIINDNVAGKNIVIVLSDDQKSFAAFERPTSTSMTFRNDSLFSGNMAYDFGGKCNSVTVPPLNKINAYQEFWHSWNYFHPESKK